MSKFKSFYGRSSKRERAVTTSLLVVAIFFVTAFILSATAEGSFLERVGSFIDRGNNPVGGVFDPSETPAITYSPSANGPGTPSVALTYPLTIDMNTTQPEDSIYYTTNGTDPTESSTLYTGPFQISTSMTVKARSYANGYDPSAIASNTFYIELPANIAPSAQGKSVNTLEDTAVDIALEYTDSDGPGPYTISIVTQPTLGSINVTGSFVTYTPNPATTAPNTDSFTWKVNDGYSDSGTVSVTINIVSSLASNAVVIDHVAVDNLWDDFYADQSAINGAATKRFYFRHASVGETIYRGLKCFGNTALINGNRSNSCTIGYTRTGTHGGSANSQTLTLSSGYFGTANTGIIDYFRSATITNNTDGSSGVVISNTGTTLTTALTGGTDNDWDVGDSFTITYQNYQDFWDSDFADLSGFMFFWHNGIVSWPYPADAAVSPQGGQNPPWYNKTSNFIEGTGRTIDENLEDYSHLYADTTDGGVRGLELDGDLTDDYDVYSYKLGYVDGITGSNTVDNFWNPNHAQTNISDLEELYDDLDAAGSDATIALWTLGLGTQIGTSVSDSFNAQLRNYAITNDKFLFDVADIFSHRPDDGSPCTYLNPADGLEHEAMCPNYSTDAGHLNGLGGQRAAQSIWLMLACIDGWSLCPVVETSTNNPPNSTFTASALTGDAPLTVNFNGSGSTDSDGTIVTYRWSFDDGVMQTGSSLSHQFTEPGTYTVTLTVIDDNGAQDAFYRTITVTENGGNQVPVPSFTIDTISGEAPLTVNVNGGASSDPDGTIANPAGYSWIWGDNTANGTGPSTSHVYNSAGNYTLSLFVTDDDGSVSSRSVQVSVSSAGANQAPTAAFTPSPSSGTAALTVNVNASASSDSDGTIASYSWNWGDASALGTGQNTSHQYSNPGVYTIVLTVTDDDGATDTASSNITVNAAGGGGGGGEVGNMLPTAIISINSYTVSTNTVTLAANHSYDSDSTSITSRAWDRDNDGLYGTEDTPAEPTTTTVNLVGLGAGTHTVGLKVTDNEGATDTTTITFELGATSAEHDFYPSPGFFIYNPAYPTSPPASVVRYGELVGGTVNIAFAHNPYSSDINQNQANDAWNANPTATGNGTTCQGTSVNCITLYEWDYQGDGTYDWSGYSAGVRTVAFTVAGTYTPTLRVTDNSGNQSILSGTLYIIDPNAGGNASPTASFTATPTSGYDPLDVDVDASASSDSDGTIVSYSWDWGDGTPDGSGATATHQYSSAGTYLLTLTVEDDEAATGTFSRTIIVSEYNSPPVAAFTPNPTSGMEPLIVSVDANASTDSDGTISGYSWDWGDGTPDSSGVSTSHEYTNAGNFMITLTVTDNEGATDTQTANINVTAIPNVPPTASFTINTTTGNAPLAVTVNGTGSTDSDGSISSYSWNWGDGTSNSSGVTPAAHTYTSGGRFLITLTVTDNDSDTDTFQRAVSVCGNVSPSSSRFYHVINSGLTLRDIQITAYTECGPRDLIN
ncbi:MAG: PKD domain-containing protein [Candidatus Dojkabacteria bacterium]|nr:MAG: PKD domain-containing protein [Candidatus Dojkabacteria bacterium]